MDVLVKYRTENIEETFLSTVAKIMSLLMHYFRMIKSTY